MHSQQIERFFILKIIAHRKILAFYSAIIRLQYFATSICFLAIGWNRVRSFITLVPVFGPYVLSKALKDNQPSEATESFIQCQQMYNIERFEKQVHQRCTQKPRKTGRWKRKGQGKRDSEAPTKALIKCIVNKCGKLKQCNKMATL